MHCFFFKNKTMMKSAGSSFHEWFLCSMQSCLIAPFPQWNFFQNWSQFSQTLPLLSQLNLCNILNHLLSGQQSSQHLHQEQVPISRNRFFASFRKSTSSCIKVLYWGCSNSVTSSGSTSNSSSLALSTTFAANFLHWSLEPFKLIHKGWNQFPLNC